MTVGATTPCPICGAPVPTWERYPNALCGACIARAADELGRPLRFRNETPLAAGFAVESGGDVVWRSMERAVCFVDGRRCVAREHRFGGVVVQLDPPEAGVSSTARR